MDRDPARSRRRLLQLPEVAAAVPRADQVEVERGSAERLDGRHEHLDVAAGDRPAAVRQAQPTRLAPVSGQVEPGAGVADDLGSRDAVALRRSVRPAVAHGRDRGRAREVDPTEVVHQRRDEEPPGAYVAELLRGPLVHVGPDRRARPPTAWARGSARASLETTRSNRRASAGAGGPRPGRGGQLGRRQPAGREARHAGRRLRQGGQARGRPAGGGWLRWVLAVAEGGDLAVSRQHLDLAQHPGVPDDRRQRDGEDLVGWLTWGESTGVARAAPNSSARSYQSVT